MESVCGAAALPSGMTLARRYDTAGMQSSDRYTLVYTGYDRKTCREVSILEFLPCELAVRVDGTSTVSPRSAACGEAFLSGVRAFSEEYRALTAAAGCTNLLSVYDAFFENGTAYAVTEPLCGARLSDYLLWTGRLLTTGELVSILSGLADGLLVLHSLSRAHGDISADTVYLSESGAAKLTGFSAARRAAFADLPEASQQNDLSALGGTLYEAYTGLPAPADATEASLAPLPEQLRGPFCRLLTSDPRARFSNVFALLHATGGLTLVREPPAAHPGLRLHYERRLLFEARRKEAARKRAGRKRILRVCVCVAALTLVTALAIRFLIKP